MENSLIKQNIDIEISNAKPEDALEINEVFYETWLDTYPNEELGITEDDIHHRFSEKEKDVEKKKRQIENLPEGMGFLVAKVENKIVGIVVYATNEEFSEIKAIYVLPEYQGLGIGYKLWQESSKNFNNEKNIFVNVADYNHKAINFYKKLGFIDTGERFVDERFKLKSGAFIPEMRMVLKPNRLK